MEGHRRRQNWAEPGSPPRPVVPVTRTVAVDTM